MTINLVDVACSSGKDEKKFWKILDELLFGGYSTISLGYAGLCECTRYMTGVSHTEPETGTPFALRVMQRLNDACAEWKEKGKYGFQSVRYAAGIHHL